MERRRRNWIRSGAAAALAWALAAGAAGGASLEYPVKAAFLTKFGAFTDWPAGSLEQSGTLRLCVVGQDPFGGTLEQTARGQAVGGRPIQVVRLAEVDRGSRCHVLYAGGSPRQSAAEALAAVRGQPVLTVTDSARGRTRGMIHFVVYEDRVRFYADQAQAERNGLSLSSKLLALALTVRR